jgi:hypothetical protein
MVARKSMQRDLSCGDDPALPGIVALIKHHTKIAKQFSCA